jgi:Ca2+-transporting ATPase
VLKYFQSDANGLSDREMLERKKKFGLNEIPDPQKKSALIIFFKQFKSLLVLVLIIAAILSYVTGNYTHVYIIIIVVLIDAIIGFVQEWRAGNAMASFQKMLSSVAKDIRNGDLYQIPSVELVLGDIIIVSEGDNIPADARLMEARNLRTGEASLTGESIPENKVVEKLPGGLPMADQTNMIRKVLPPSAVMERL